MKKIFKRAAFATAFMTAALSMSAFAATITDVKFTYEMEDSDSVSEGISLGEFTVDDDTEYSVSLDDYSELTSAKSEKTCKLIFSANGDYTFPSSASSINVQGTGINSITSKTVKDDGQTLEVKVKVWPYQKLPTPEVTSSDYSGSTVAFSSDLSGTFEYVITYIDFYGDYHTVHSTTTSKSVKVSSYNKARSESQMNNQDKYTNDKEVTGFAVRMTKLASSSNPYIMPSDWSSELDDADFEFTTYDTWSDWIDGRTSTSGSSSKSNVINNTTSTSSGGWTGSGDSWYYKNAAGTVATGWVLDGGNYYYCDPSNSGKMKAGWFKDTDGNWYYLNPNHDGTYGRMMTSWQTINGVKYYFRPNSGGPMGSMVSNATVSINGTKYTFNADGANIG